MKRSTTMRVCLLNFLASAVIVASWTQASAATTEESSQMSVSWLTGNLYLVEDSHFVATNSLIYIGKSSVTVVGATWTPETAKELETQIKSLTALPVRDVI